MSGAKIAVGFAALALVDGLFAVKYFSRYTGWYWLLACIIITLHALFYYGKGLPLVLKRHPTIVGLALLMLFCVGSLWLFGRVPVESLHVDRWSVITSFWDNWFDGRYVYAARSHMDNPPGPMPFYFVSALPFYLLGELGLYSLAGIVVFWLLLRYIDPKPSGATSMLLLIMTAPFYLWEVVVRSNLFLNASLIAFTLVVVLRIKRFNALTLLATGIATGLMLSTRNVLS